MELERAARLTLARLHAKRFGRGVPEREMRLELGIPDARGVLDALERAGLAMLTPDGWRPTAPRVESRVRTECASMAWLLPEVRG